MGMILSLTASDGHGLSAYRADPDGTPTAGLVVLQEIFGVNDHIRAVCDGFARDGYVAVAPALFDRFDTGIDLGYTAADMARGRAYKDRADTGQAMADIQAAVDGLAPRVGKIGVVGYCWGGFLAWLAAAELSVTCAVSYYGGGITAVLDRKPKIPLLMHFGATDQAIPISDVDKIRGSLETAPLRSRGGWEIHIYPGADHGFNCDHRATHHAAAAAQARDRTLAFFANQLG